MLVFSVPAEPMSFQLANRLQQKEHTHQQTFCKIEQVEIIYNKETKLTERGMYNMHILQMWMSWMYHMERS